MTLYEILGIQRDATPDAIKKAYQRRASLTHPDKGGTDAEFQEVKHAFEVLSDIGRRTEYDLTGIAGETRIPDIAGMFATLLEHVLQNIPSQDLWVPAGASTLRNKSDIKKIMETNIGEEVEVTRMGIKKDMKAVERLERFVKRLAGDSKANKLAVDVLKSRIGLHQKRINQQEEHSADLMTLKVFLEDFIDGGDVTDLQLSAQSQVNQQMYNHLNNQGTS